MRISVCIPNYNYGSFIAATVESVLSQDQVDLELCISDNASTDSSLDVVESFRDSRIKVQRNKVNVGFARNLDCAAAMATGGYVIMLSSDDLMAPGALARYQGILSEAERRGLGAALISSSLDVIDAQGRVIGHSGPDPRLWDAGSSSRQDFALAAGVVSTGGHELLRRSITHMANPFNFCTLAYPRALGEAVGGYGGNRLVNPDKWFNWSLLAAGAQAIYVDEPLFQYRWHEGNQTAQQRRSGALKYLVDEYVSTFQITDSTLQAAGLSRREVERAFIRADIGRHGLASIGSEGWVQGLRAWAFGFATYPGHALSCPWWWLLGGTLATGPVGWAVSRWRRNHTPRFGRA